MAGFPIKIEGFIGIFIFHFIICIFVRIGNILKEGMMLIG